MTDSSSDKGYEGRKSKDTANQQWRKKTSTYNL
jgi:hypothetical protein